MKQKLLCLAVWDYVGLLETQSCQDLLQEENTLLLFLVSEI